MNKSQFHMPLTAAVDEYLRLVSDIYINQEDSPSAVLTAKQMVTLSRFHEECGGFAGPASGEVDDEFTMQLKNVLEERFSSEEEWFFEEMRSLLGLPTSGFLERQEEPYVSDKSRYEKKYEGEYRAI